MAVTVNITPRHLATGDWSISLVSNSPTSATYSDCVLLKLGEFSIGSQSDLDESFNLPPNVDLEIAIRPLTEQNLNLFFNLFTIYTTEVTITKDGSTYFKGYVDPVQTEINPYNYSIKINVSFASFITKSTDSKTNPLGFNISSTAPMTNNYFIWYYYDKFFEYQNLSPHYNTLIVDENIIGRYDDGLGGFFYSTVDGYNNTTFTSYLTTVNPYWFSTGYANNAPAQLGDTLKNLAKELGLIFTVGLENKYYLQSRWKISGKTTTSITREQTIDHYTRTILGKDGLVVKVWSWNGTTWLLDNTYTEGIVTYNADGTIANSSQVETLNVHNIYAGGNYVGGYPGDIRYNANYIITEFSVDGGSAFGNLADVLTEPIASNVLTNRRNTVITVNGIDWDYMDYYTIARELDTYTYRCRMLKIDVEKNQTTLDLVQIF
ncbi:MAG: YdhH/YoaO family protein [Bacteroidetes bacterium]|nr:YdhH/YoaO family protein [Bacteroidota bacterium]